MLHRRKLLALFLLAGASSLLIFSYAVDTWLRISFIQNRTEALWTEARILASRIRLDDPVLKMVIDGAARSLPRQISVHDEKGNVVADSSLSEDQLKDIGDQSKQPEIEEAARSGTGANVRFSTNLQQDLLYVAVKLPDQSGYLRLAASLVGMEAEISRLRNRVVGAGLLLQLILIVCIVAFLRRLSASLKLLAEAAERMASGDSVESIALANEELLGTLAGTLASVSKHVQRERSRLEEECSHLSTILGSMSEGVMVTDLSGRIVETNPAFLRIFNLARNPLGRLPLEVIRSVEVQNSIERVIGQGRDQEAEVHFGGRIIQARFAPILIHGRTGGVVIAFYDITELRRLEKIRKEFVSNVSHELRTPLTSIQGFSETLLNEPGLAPQHRKFASKILRSAQQLSAIIGELLELARIEGGDALEKSRPVRFETLMQELAADFENRLKEKGIQFSFENRSGQEFFQAGEVYIKRVFDNLLDNALKYTPAGSVRIEMSKVGGELLFSVRDTGIGIPAEDLERIFERFYRVDKDRSRATGGSGIGLAIVKHIIQLHKGRVWAESRPGQGTAIFFTLPA